MDDDTPDSHPPGRAPEFGSMITHVDARGIVVELPAVIAAALAQELGRPVSRDVSALARMLASETNAHHPETAPIRAHVCLNDLDDLNRRRGFGWTIEDLITYSSMPVHRGHFGEQRWGRRYASDKDGAEAYVDVAELAITDHAAGIDPTGGALKFVDKRSLAAQAGAHQFDDIARSWASEGLHPFQLAGYPSDLYVFRRTA